jgi:general secretion pathway protein H
VKPVVVQTPLASSYPHPALRATFSRGEKGKAIGFTLLEMLLVLALVAIVTTLAATALTGGLEGMRLRNAAKEVAGQLRYTRAQAIASGVPQKFALDPVAHTWASPQGKHGSIPRSLSIRFTGARQAQVGEGMGGILFFSDGASTGGRVQLQAGDVAWRVDVAWVTGEVKLSRVEAAP